MDESNFNMKAGVDKYRANANLKGEVVGEICETVIRNHSDFGFRDGSCAADLLAEYYPRMGGLLERYQPGRGSFETYLKSNLSHFRRELWCRAQEMKFRDRALLESETAESDAVIERATSAYSAEGMHEGADAGEIAEGVFAPPSAKASRPGGYHRACTDAAMGKRILILALKCADSLGEDQVAKIERVLGLGKGHLQCRVDILKGFVDRRRARFESFRHTRDRTWTRLFFLRLRHRAGLDDYRRAILDEREERAAKSCRNLANKIRKVGLEPTNEEVALVLGIPSGTVDSGLYYLKRKFLPGRGDGPGPGLSRLPCEAGAGKDMLPA